MYNDGQNDDLAGVTIQPPTAVVINSPRRLSISEPTSGYPAYVPTSLEPPGHDAVQPDNGIAGVGYSFGQNLIVPAPADAWQGPTASQNNGRTTT